MAMDIPRGKAHKRRRMILRVLYSIFGLAAVGAVSYYIMQLEPAAPSVSDATVWKGEVKRGTFVRQVRGPGTLVPEEEIFIPAVTQGRVERIVLKPGVEVRPESIILELSNPELERDALDARLSLQAEEARFRDLEIQLESQLLTQKANAASIQSQFDTAKLEADLNKELQQEGLIDNLTVQRSTIQAENLATRNELEQERLRIQEKSTKAQLEARQSDIDKLKSMYELRLSQMEALKVRAGIGGQLQEVPVDVGMQVSPGTVLARVARPDQLMAELQIAETQANEIVVGQPANIDTRNGVIPGHVIRIDPAAQGGLVQVDVALDGALPTGARPQLSVDGTVEIERLSDVLIMGRPAYGQADQTISLFKILADNSAVRVQVQLGRSSVNEIEVVNGLQEGDRVILSDTSNYDDYDKIRLVQ